MRRERRQHVGLLAYGRSMGSQALPRAITFTAGFYSIGVPPEFIGFGRSMQAMSDEERGILFEEYRSLKTDLERAGRYLNTENLAILAAKNKAWEEVQADVAAAEEILGIKFGAQTAAEKAHQNLTSNALLLQDDQMALSHAITEMAHLRKSLG